VTSLSDAKEKSVMIDVRAITELHRETVQRWHVQQIDNPFDGFLHVVCLEHQQNFRLWHQEDIARSPVVSDADLAQVKRTIDQLNQRRNDLIEELDNCLLQQLGALGVTPMPDAVLNTETPGSAIDRLSILTLRLFHMEEQAFRTDVQEEHLVKVKSRLEILQEQHRDLSTALQVFWDDILAGRKRLKLYRQFKMYNDPTLNPYLYNPHRRSAA
jgi:cell division protein FtsB